MLEPQAEESIEGFWKLWNPASNLTQQLARLGFWKTVVLEDWFGFYLWLIIRLSEYKTTHRL